MAKTSSMSDLPSKHKLDSGYSWLVLASSFMINLIILGQIVSFSIYTLSFTEEFHSTRKSTSIAGAISYSLMCLLGPVSSVLQKQYGARLVIMTGALLATVGMSLSYFATKLWHLYLTYGLLCGLGYGLCLTPSIAILPEYFGKWLYFCTTFATVGVSVGSLILPPFTYFLIEHYSWRGSMLIHAGLCFQILVFGAICKSRLFHKEASLKDVFEVAIVKNKMFMLLLVDAFILGGTCFTVMSMINSLVIGRGLSKWQGAKLISVMGLSDTAARVSASMISNFKCTDRTILYSAASIVSASGIFACVFCFNFLSFAAALFAFGLAVGIKFSQPANVIIDLFGVEHVVIGFGFFMFAVGAGGFLLPLAAGWLADKTSTQNAFVLSSVECVVGFTCCCILLFLRWKRNRNLAIAADAHDGGIEVKNFD